MFPRALKAAWTPGIVIALLALIVAACGAAAPEPEAADTPADAAAPEQPATGDDAAMTPGRFVNDPHSGRDFNLADFEAAYGVTLREFNEAPMLQALVEAGSLPPVAERLPANPAVQIPLEDIGRYGGNLHWVEYTIDYDHYLRHLNETNLLELRPAQGTARYKWMGGEIMPGVYEAWNRSADSRTFEFTLREGLKWSDGVAVTTEDIRFYVEDVLRNEEVTPNVPAWLKYRGQPTVFEVLDEYAVRFTFAEPNGFFLPEMVNWAWDRHLRPAHYFKAYHTGYTDIADLLPLMEQMEFTAAEDWGRWFAGIQANASDGAYMRRTPDYRDMPVLQPYVWDSEPQQGEFIMTRNPYFYKVDPEGNQLPYIDSVSRSLVTDIEVENLKIISGETDIQGQFIRLSDYPMFAQNQEAGNYHLMALPAWQDQLLIFPFNFDPADPVLGAIVRDKRFRQALSLAVDREEVKKSIFLDFGVPSAFAPVAGSPWYKDEFRDAYAEFDVERANALLDDMGLAWDENGEFRLRPDGERLVLPIDYYDVTPPATPGGELIREFWLALGVDTKVEQVNGQFYWQKRGANETVGTIWWANGLPPADAVFVSSFLMTPSWWSWYNTQREEGTEPQDPEAVRLVELFWELQTATTAEEQTRLGIEIFESHKENVWNVGTVASAPQPFVYNRGLGNLSVAEERGYYHISLMELSEQFYWK